MAVRKTSISSYPMGYKSSFAKGDNVTLFIFTFVGGEIYFLLKNLIIFAFTQNKLAKLGDAIAISKSETM